MFVTGVACRNPAEISICRLEGGFLNATALSCRQECDSAGGAGKGFRSDGTDDRPHHVRIVTVVSPLGFALPLDQKWQSR